MTRTTTRTTTRTPTRTTTKTPTRATTCRLLPLLLLPLACGGGSDPAPPVTPVSILEFPPALAPGAPLYLETDAFANTLEIRVGGVLLTGPEIVGFEGGLGTVLSLPDTTPIGMTTLSVRVAGEASDADSVAIDVVEPMFQDVSADVGLDLMHDVSDYPIDCEESVTGLAVADFDEDGDVDVYVGNLGGAGGRLMRNDLGTFNDVTAAVGLDVIGVGGIDLVSAASFVDYDNDGDKDLFVGRVGANVLMQNQLDPDVGGGTATFVDVTAAAGLGAEDQRTMGAGWGDFDLDGDLDLYLINHSFCYRSPGGPDQRGADHLYRNEDGVFEEVTDFLGGGTVEELDYFGYSAVFLDHDEDGDQDLFVINDHIFGTSGPNVLWRNDGASAVPEDLWLFTDVSVASGLEIFPDAIGVSKGVDAMGVAVGDVNRDGHADLAISNIGPNHVLFGDGAGTFTDVSEALGIQRTLTPWDFLSITWGTNFLDYDNDGDLDLFYTGGQIRNSDGTDPIPNAFFSQNTDGTFTEITWPAGLADLGHGKSSALVDLDRDGFPDLLAANWGEDLRVFRNRSADLGNANHWLVVELEGTTSNRDAIGARIAVTTPDGVTQTAWRTCKPSLGTGGELASFFGLGANTSVTSIEITWPDGLRTTTMPTPPSVDTRVTYVEP